MSACSLRHLMRTYSPVRMCGRCVHKLVFLFFAVFLVLNFLYVLPFTSEFTSLLIRRYVTGRDVRHTSTFCYVQMCSLSLLTSDISIHLGSSVRLPFSFVTLTCASHLLRSDPRFPCLFRLSRSILPFGVVSLYSKEMVCYSYFGYSLLKAAVDIYVGIVYAL